MPLVFKHILTWTFRVSTAFFFFNFIGTSIRWPPNFILFFTTIPLVLYIRPHNSFWSCSSVRIIPSVLICWTEFCTIWPFSPCTKLAMPLETKIQFLIKIYQNEFMLPEFCWLLIWNTCDVLLTGALRVKAQQVFVRFGWFTLIGSIFNRTVVLRGAWQAVWIWAFTILRSS